MIDELWADGPRFVDAKGVYRIGTDSVLLAYFANDTGIKKKTLAADLGCGSGIISILLATLNQNLTVDAIELLPEAAESARKSAELSGVKHKINVIESDLRNHREYLRPGAYDLVVANPPYYALGTGALSDDTARRTARSELTCSLEDILSAAGYLTRWGGSFSLVHKPERLCDVFRAMNKHGIEPKRMRLVQNKADSPPSLALIEGRRGGKPSLKIEAPLILRNSDDTDSDEINKIYHRNL